MSKVLDFMADGTEEIEALTVVDLLRRAGISVETVSISDEPYITGSHNIKVGVDTGISSVSIDDACMIVLPGGMPGTNKLMDCEKLSEWLNEFARNGKYLAAICAAPSILGVNGLLAGKRATCFPGFEDKLLSAHYECKPVVVDGNIITSRGLGTAIEFSAAIITCILGEEAADSILEKIVYKQ